MNLFVFHAFKHGTPDDKRFARYIIWNELKGAMICNAFLFMFAATKFKNYRNSRLLALNAMATVSGLLFAAEGLFPLFASY